MDHAATERQLLLATQSVSSAIIGLGFTPQKPRGVLGDYPIGAESSPDASRPAGILYPYNDSEGRSVYNRGVQLSDRPSFNPFGGAASPIVSPQLSGHLNAAPRVAPLLLSPALSSPPTGQLADIQPSMGSQSGTEVDHPRGTSLGFLNATQPGNVLAPHRLQPAPNAPEFPNDQTYRNFGISARIHDSGASEWPSVGNDDWTSQYAWPKNQDHWSAYLQPAQEFRQSDKTGDPHIDRTTEFLLDALVAATRDLGPNMPEGMRANVFGTIAHARFAKKVRELDLPGIGQSGVEQTWSPEDFFYCGIAGSKRTDVYLKDELGRPIAIYDLKTGNARLTRARAKELQDAVGAGNIPIIELSWNGLAPLGIWR